jgi:hypothetical protein
MTVSERENVPLFLESDFQNRILTFGVERSGVRLALLERVNREHRLIGWIGVARAQHQTMLDQIAEACRRLGRRLGCVLWDEDEGQPFMRALDPIRYPPIEQVVAAVSPRTLLRVYIAGITRSLSLKALQQALLSAPVQIVGGLVYTANTSVDHVAHDLVEQQPDVIVIVGGYEQSEQPPQRAVLSVCRRIGQAMERLPRGHRPFIVYAGQQASAADASLFLGATDGAMPFAVVENLMPAPDRLRPAALTMTLHTHYQQLTQRMTGCKELANWIAPPAKINLLEDNFVQFVRLWLDQYNVSRLHGLYTQQDCWFHVWAEANQNAVHLCYTAPGEFPAHLADWPPIQLVCGEWPAALAMPAALTWWDRTGLTPALMALAPAAPLAMWQVMHRDLFL